MPEGLEAEIWRRAAQPIVGRRIREVWCDERVAAPGLADSLRGARVEGVDRVGKVVRIATDGGVLGLHLGMTGRIEVDGMAPIERLEYASGADRAEWDRLRLMTIPAASKGASAVPALRMNDPRRLGRLSLDEQLSLGPDSLTLTSAELRTALARRSASIKAALLDQAVVAGLGNLCVDEVLFWAGVAPARRVDELQRVEITAIARACRTRLVVMLNAGGSTCGVLSPAVRAQLAPCPRDGAPLQRSRIGGRTSVWCPKHQR